MVQTVGIFEYPAALNTVVADGKPHKEAEIDLDATGTTKPMMLVVPDAVAAKTWKLAPVASANIIWSQSLIAVVEIPDDYPDRSQYDKTTVFSASATKVPAKILEPNREYSIVTATDMTGYNEGQLLVCAAAGDLSKVTDESPDALVVLTHGFQLKYAVSATEIVVKYLGLIPVDMS